MVPGCLLNTSCELAHSVLMNIYVQGRYEYSPPPFCRQGNKLTSRDQNEPRPFSSKLRVLFHGTQPVRSLLWRSGHISVSRLYAAMQRRLFETSLAASGCVELPGFRVGTTRGGERKGEDIRADTVPSALDWDLTRPPGKAAPHLSLRRLSTEAGVLLGVSQMTFWAPSFRLWTRNK